MADENSNTVGEIPDPDFEAPQFHEVHLQSSSHIHHEPPSAILKLEGALRRSWELLVADWQKVRLEKIKKLVEIAGIFIAAIALRVYSGQLDAMRNGLQQSEESGRQTAQLIINAAHQVSETRDLVTQAKTQATQMTTLATQATTQANRMATLATQAIAQAAATNRLADQASKQASAAETANDRNREIQSARLVVLNEFSCEDVTTTADVANHAVNLRFSFEIKNEGPSVAEGLSFVNGSAMWNTSIDEKDPDFAPVIKNAKPNPDGPNLGTQSSLPYVWEGGFYNGLIRSDYRTNDTKAFTFFVFLVIPYTDIFHRPHLVTECVQYRPWKGGDRWRWMRCYFGHSRS